MTEAELEAALLKLEQKRVKLMESLEFNERRIQLHKALLMIEQRK